VTGDRPSGAAAIRDDTILSVEDLKVTMPRAGRPVELVRGVGFSLQRGEVLGLVGESGSGKTMTALSILGLQPGAAARSGRIVILGQDMSGASGAQLRAVRGGTVGMVFQDPLTSLNPVMPVGKQVAESLIEHLGMSKEAAASRTVDLLRAVGIPDAARRAGDAPGAFSGGMRQRVMIAMAVACEPPLIIADEPTSALDVTVQAQVLDVLSDLRERMGLTILIITHDLGVVAAIADRVAVMYAGRLVEVGSAEAVLERPHHPYTRALVAATPRIDLPIGAASGAPGIAGSPPDPAARPAGCPFAPRCPHAFERCHVEPGLFTVGTDHLSACWLATTTP